MICRIWHGWTTPANADAYEHVVRAIVIPGIEARRIDGFLSIDLIRRPADNEVEFATIMWFTSLEAIVAFVGDDATVSHVPAPARAVLNRFDAHAQHYEVLERRPQTHASRSHGTAS